jgi:hypothetical protein
MYYSVPSDNHEIDCNAFSLANSGHLSKCIYPVERVYAFGQFWTLGQMHILFPQGNAAGLAIYIFGNFNYNKVRTRSLA